MFWLKREVMRRRRIDLGLTSEQLADEAGLDRRTVQRLEQQKNRARLGTVIALAEVLSLKPSSLILADRPSVIDEGDEARVLAAFEAADHAIQTTLSDGGEWGVKEAIAVLSLLLTRYGLSFSLRTEDSVEAGFSMVRVACDQIEGALLHQRRNEEI